MMAKLFMLLIGCTPAGRHTEQHDVFFAIGDSIRDIMPAAIKFWPEAKSSFHLDAWREVTLVNGFRVTVADSSESSQPDHLFFINLGGYKQGFFEEYHYKMILAAADKNDAMRQSKQTAFFEHTGFKGASAHIDDKYGIDIDDIFIVKDILPKPDKKRYRLVVEPAAADAMEDKIHLGYFKPAHIDKWAPLSSLL